jgi:uncharacterized 2Fe-2S/4Fe-4S cluster protein (DUF4445 family)
LLSLVHALKGVGVIDASGRMAEDHASVPLEPGPHEALQVRLSDRVALTQFDVRELQKAKGAIRIAADILLERVGVAPRDLSRVFLTGSFGGQLSLEASLDLGLIPPVPRERIELVANGAGLGAAMFLQDQGFKCGEDLAARARHVELDLEPDFNMRFIEAMTLE